MKNQTLYCAYKMQKGKKEYIIWTLSWYRKTCKEQLYNWLGVKLYDELVVDKKFYKIEKVSVTIEPFKNTK